MLAVALLALGALVAVFFIYQVYALGYCSDTSQACQNLHATAQLYEWLTSMGGFVALVGLLFLWAYYARSQPAR